MTAEENPARAQPAHGSHGRAQSCLIVFCASARRRSVRAVLSEGKIAAKDRETLCAESIRQRREQRGLAIGAGAVRQNQAIRAGVRWAM
jgi:hypothetical protein